MAWTVRGNIRGPQGLQGQQGIQGIEGPIGPTGKSAHQAAVDAGLTTDVESEWITESTVKSGVTNTFAGKNAAPNVSPDAFADGTGNGGYNNTIMGSDAALALTKGLRNTLIGNGVALSMTTGYYNEAFGDGALRDTVGPLDITGTPEQSIGCRNTAIGSNALAHNTDGYENVAVGRNAAHTNTTGRGITAIGRNAYSGKYVPNDPLQQDVKTANDVTAIGDNALFNANVSGVVAVGANSQYKNVSGVGNVSVGLDTLFNNLAPDNTAVGNNSMQANINGRDNTAVGATTMLNSDTSGNTAIGAEALRLLTTGNGGNTALGWHALYGVETGEYNTAVGYAAVSGPLTKNGTAIGRGSDVRHDNSVALGALTVTQGNDTVAFGSRSIDFGIKDAPGYPPAGYARFNVNTNTSGKMIIRILWPSNSVTILGTEP